MAFSDLLGITPNPVASASIWVVLLITLLYFARSSGHKLVLTFSRTLHDTMRLGSHALANAERALRARNREVLLAAGREAKERIIDREFDRVADAVEKDLGSYPQFQRNLSDVIVRIEEDYQKTMESFDQTVGLDKLRIFHFNDSKRAWGSRVDRHEHIGRGEIGTSAFASILNDERLTGVPKILETPKGKTHREDKRNLKVLRSLIKEV